MKVAVVGGGIVGLSAARFLAARGHTVTLYEQFPMFHDNGSSHGRTRIIRRAYPDAFYTACMAEAYPMWAELEQECGQKLVEECGLLYFGKSDSPRIRGVVDALTELSVPHEVLDAASVGDKLPGARMQPDEVGIFTPEAGRVDAAGALRATFDLAKAGGLELVQEVATRERLESAYDVFVVAAGGWIRHFVDVDVRVTTQTFQYAGAPQPGPVWIDDTSLTYGIPGDPLGHKIGAHSPGQERNPAQGVGNTPTTKRPSPSHLVEIREVAMSRFGIDPSALRDTTTCLYTSTPDENFRIGRLGEKGVFASACSGHGFKLGPWVGRLLANIVEGKDSPENHPRFLWPR